MRADTLDQLVAVGKRKLAGPGDKCQIVAVSQRNQDVVHGRLLGPQFEYVGLADGWRDDVEQRQPGERVLLRRVTEQDGIGQWRHQLVKVDVDGGFAVFVVVRDIDDWRLAGAAIDE